VINSHQDRDELALVSQEAAIGVVTSIVGQSLGPAGAVVGAFLGPFAVHAAKRISELVARVDEVGLEKGTIVERLNENEALAQLVAEVVRATVESDLGAKRALLAQAAIRALRDDAAVDVEARVVRVAVAIDTVDVRVLAMVAEPPERPEPEDESQRRAEGAMYPDELVARWPGAEEILSTATSSLIAAGLIENAGIGTFGGETFWKLSPFGRRFLDRLLQEGLEDELGSSSRTTPEPTSRGRTGRA
jgi:hypothetical protein